jgi:hypothetical protein
MGYEAKKTEHSAPKRGQGAYWGYDRDAKKESNRVRRTNRNREIRNAITAATDGAPVVRLLRRAYGKRVLRCQHPH